MFTIVLYIVISLLYICEGYDSLLYRFCLLCRPLVGWAWDSEIRILLLYTYMCVVQCIAISYSYISIILFVYCSYLVHMLRYIPPARKNGYADCWEFALTIKLIKSILFLPEMQITYKSVNLDYKLLIVAIDLVAYQITR